MKVQILGTGCPKCRALEANVRQAIAEMAIAAEIEKVTGIDAIMAMGVLMTPALAVDGDIKSEGKILTKNQIIETLKAGF